MSDGTIYLAMTIDCERLHADYQKVSKGEGPPDWRTSAANLAAFAEIVESHGGRGTFYVVPAAAERHADLFRELNGRGHEVGLHLHPCVFEEVGRYGAGIATHPPDRQRSLLAAAADAWAKAIGRRPRTYRPGNFSANDDTFAAAVELGMRYGSVSCPGRDCPGIGAVWTDAAPWTCERAGFVDVPLTTAPDKLRPNGFPLELRIERTGDSPDDMPLQVLRRRLDELADWPVDRPRSIVSLTHTHVPYHARPGREMKVIAGMVEQTTRRAREFGAEMTVCTVGEIAAAFGRLRKGD